MGVPLPISRNLTTIFQRQRRDYLEKRGRASMGGLLAADSTQEGRQLLGEGSMDRKIPGGDHIAVEMAALPPQWVDSAEEAREDIKAIRDKLAMLTKAQQKRLLKVFSDNSVPDKDVEALTSQISVLLRHCEQNIHAVKTRGVGPEHADKEREFRENVQRKFATELQKLSQHFRQMQKGYMSDIQKRQKCDVSDKGAAVSYGGMATDVGFSELQMQEVEDMEISANSRSEEITQITTSISDLHTIFKELAVLVIDQGSILDRIDYNIEEVVDQSREANVQLQKAEKSQKNSRATRCMLVLVLFNVILILILIAKARH